jgi:hypothetical protein
MRSGIYHRFRSAQVSGLTGRLLVLTVLAAASGCGRRNDGWYEESSGLQQRKDSRLDELQQQGYNREEAAASWALEVSIEKTTGRGPQEPIEGRELQDAMGGH